MTIQIIDRQLLELHAKLRNETNPVLKHRLIQQIDRLLDQRNQLTK